jgi:hypothetical protein
MGRRRAGYRSQQYHCPAEAAFEQFCPCVIQPMERRCGALSVPWIGRTGPPIRNVSMRTERASRAQGRVCVRSVGKCSPAGGGSANVVSQPSVNAATASLPTAFSGSALKQRYHEFPDGTPVGRDLYCAFLARFVVGDRLDAIHAAEAWTGAQAFLRAASDGFEAVYGCAS